MKSRLDFVLYFTISPIHQVLRNLRDKINILKIILLVLSCFSLLFFKNNTFEESLTGYCSLKFKSNYQGKLKSHYTRHRASVVCSSDDITRPYTPTKIPAIPATFSPNPTAFIRSPLNPYSLCAR